MEGLVLGICVFTAVMKRKEERGDQRVLNGGPFPRCFDYIGPCFFGCQLIWIQRWHGTAGTRTFFTETETEF